jgi:transposase-like protein
MKTNADLCLLAALDCFMKSMGFRKRGRIYGNGTETVNYLNKKQGDWVRITLSSYDEYWER